MITYHRAQIEDASEVKKLLYITWNETYSDIYSQEAIDMVMSDWHSVELITEQISDKTAYFGIAKDAGKIIGMCNATITNGVVNIQRLHVLPSHQRQGIGTVLLNKAVDSFHNAKKIDLEVEKQNNRAIAFYKKQGFEEK